MNFLKLFNMWLHCDYPNLMLNFLIIFDTYELDNCPFIFMKLGKSIHIELGISWKKTCWPPNQWGTLHITHILEHLRHFNSFEALCEVFDQPCFYNIRIVDLTPNPETGETLSIGCPQMLIQYIRSQPLYLEIYTPIPIRNLSKSF